MQQENPENHWNMRICGIRAAWPKKVNFALNTQNICKICTVHISPLFILQCKIMMPQGANYVRVAPPQKWCGCNNEQSFAMSSNLLWNCTKMLKKIKIPFSRHALAQTGELVFIWFNSNEIQQHQGTLKVLNGRDAHAVEPSTSRQEVRERHWSSCSRIRGIPMASGGNTLDWRNCWGGNIRCQKHWKNPSKTGKLCKKKMYTQDLTGKE